MFQQAALSSFALLLPAGLAAQPDAAPAPLDPGGAFLLILILTGAGLLAVRKERR